MRELGEEGINNKGVAIEKEEPRYGPQQYDFGKPLTLFGPQVLHLRT
jgi:hypothetical protein